MKTFSFHQIRTAIAVTTIGTLLAVAYIVNPNFFKASNVQAGASQNVSGWVWSETIGWVSFNSLGCDSDKNGFVDAGICGGNNTSTIAQDYGVSVGTGNKEAGLSDSFSGTAWSDNVGWVSFDRTKTGNPPLTPFNTGSGPIAQIDWSTGKVSGWMRALSACQDNLVDALGNCTASDAGDEAGGWDGWIRLAPTSVTSPWWGHGVQISANKFSGYAWGSDVVGWVDFSPNVGSINVGPVIGVPPCVAADVPEGSWGVCQQIGSCPADAGLTFGIRVGLCSTGGTVTQPCTTSTGLVCAPAGGGGAVVAGCSGGVTDGVCGAGETPVSCPQDCKVKFRQF